MTDRVQHRPKIYPPPEFPPRRPALFARTPPAVFPSLLGLLGLGLALRRGLAEAGLPAAPGEMVLGLAVGLWLFAILAYGVKLARRPAVLIEDLRVLPGRAGLATATIGALVVAAALVPLAPGLARGVLFAGLLAHGALAVVLVAVLRGLPSEAREVNPAWHLSFVGFIVGGLAAVPLGEGRLALALIGLTLPVAALIWGVSLAQLVSRVPPAPLRPLLAIHLAPASLFASVAALAALPMLAHVMAGLALAIAVALAVAFRWIAVAGFSAMWGAFTFPVAALATALLLQGGAFVLPGMIALVVALGAVPLVAWRVVAMWPKGTLAARTNAAEA